MCVSVSLSRSLFSSLGTTVSYRVYSRGQVVTFACEEGKKVKKNTVCLCLLLQLQSAAKPPREDLKVLLVKVKSIVYLCVRVRVCLLSSLVAGEQQRIYKAIRWFLCVQPGKKGYRSA